MKSAQRMKWEDNVVFLTGASSGIGEGLALALAQGGAALGLVARREGLLCELAARCEAVGGKAHVFACDVADGDSLREAAENLRTEFGKIDILIANAGIGG
ncbi:MAG: SDR family NAD(P)-dependent oxidoreductase, partial [Pyrinomonadaceae bacterium]